MVEDDLVGLWRWWANRAVLLVRDLEATVLKPRCLLIWSNPRCNTKTVVKIQVRLDV